MSMNESVGARIRQLRLRKFGAQREVAKLLSISIPGYYKLEAGITDINLSRLIHLAEIFGVKPEALLADRVELSDLKVEIAGLKERLSKSQGCVIELQAKLIKAHEMVVALKGVGKNGEVLDLIG